MSPSPPLHQLNDEARAYREMRRRAASRAAGFDEPSDALAQIHR
jgi:hypothetical protein